MSPAFKTCPTTVHDAAIWTGTCYMDLIDPNPAEIHFADIARALSRLARFNGLTTQFYSVAEHSVLCLRAFQAHAAGDIYADPRLCDIACDILLHDAAEAYLGDVARPLKRCLPDYRALEPRMEAAIAARFDLAGAAPEWIKRVDLELLALEKDQLMPGCGPWPVTEGVALPDLEIACLSPEAAETLFCAEATRLGLIPPFGVRPAPARDAKGGAQ